MVYLSIFIQVRYHWMDQQHSLQNAMTPVNTILSVCLSRDSASQSAPTDTFF